MAKIIDPDFILRAYSVGIFPMAIDRGEMAWFSPDPRGIIPLDTFHVPHGLRRTLRRNPFEIRFDHAFDQVIAGCSDRAQTWIDETIRETYSELSRRGAAHSVEAWQGDRLVGGLYGVSIGGAFFGESMFSRVSAASQACLVALVERLNERGFVLLDTQWTTPHLARFGAIEVSKARYLELLHEAVARSCEFP